MGRSKYPLTTQTNHLFIVIRKNKEIPIDTIKTYCNLYFEEWSFIEHKNDVEPVTGIIEGTHYHIIGNSKKTKTRLSTHLNDIVEFFKFDNDHGIQIDKYDNYVSGLQYLIHKNDSEKTQHKVSEIQSSLSEEELNTILSSDSQQSISFDYVYSICIHSNNIVEVIRLLGFKIYSKYRSTINDIFSFVHKRKEDFKKDLNDIKN